MNLPVMPPLPALFHRCHSGHVRLRWLGCAGFYFIQLNWGCPLRARKAFQESRQNRQSRQTKGDPLKPME
jgi:hypothetical protein